MPKYLTRIIVSLVIPSLIADPSFAAYRLLAIEIPTVVTGRPSPFADQALIEPVREAFRNGGDVFAAWLTRLTPRLQPADGSLEGLSNGRRNPNKFAEKGGWASYRPHRRLKDRLTSIFFSHSLSDETGGGSDKVRRSESSLSQTAIEQAQKLLEQLRSTRASSGSQSARHLDLPDWSKRHDDQLVTAHQLLDWRKQNLPEQADVKIVTKYANGDVIEFPVLYMDFSNLGLTFPAQFPDKPANQPMSAHEARLLESWRTDLEQLEHGMPLLFQRRQIQSHMDQAIHGLQESAFAAVVEHIDATPEQKRGIVIAREFMREFGYMLAPIGGPRGYSGFAFYWGQGHETLFVGAGTRGPIESMTMYVNGVEITKAAGGDEIETFDHWFDLNPSVPGHAMEYSLNGVQGLLAIDAASRDALPRFNRYLIDDIYFRYDPSIPEDLMTFLDTSLYLCRLPPP